MRFAPWLVFPILGLCGLLCTLTFTSLGASAMEEPEGISLRQESAGSPNFFYWYARSRSHRGGGPHGGK